MTDKKKRTRRGRGEGSVTQRPDGSWQARLSVGSNADGSRRRIFVNAPTKSEALDELSRRRAAIDQGTLVGPDQVTVEGFLARWMLATAKSVSGATHDSYAQNIATWINPRIGQYKLQKLDSLLVEAMLSDIIEQRSARLAQYNRTILRQALKDAVRWGLVTRNVTDLVDPPTVPAAEFKVWDEAQTKRALAECSNERLGAITAIGLLCGMRQGEILALQWPDIDFKHNRIHVRRTQSTVKGEVILKPPKTKSGVRTIEFTATLAEILHSHKARMLKEGHLKQPFVFVNEAGKMLDRFGDVKSSFLRIGKAAGNPAMGFHCTRHTHATLLLRCGTNAKVVQERLGHSTVNITLQLYSHVMPAMQTEAVEKLDKLLG